MHMLRNLLVTSSAIVVAGSLSACAQMPSTTSGNTPVTTSYHPNSIQPETTLDITAEATTEREPDIAYITTGVSEEAKTAEEAMAAQATAMNGVFEAIAAAGIENRDMQTSNLSLQPVYDYIEETDGNGRTRGKQLLRGYIASNQLTVKVSDLGNLGETLDSLVAAGGNTFSGLTFALDDPTEAQDEARRKAVEMATARAQLFADAAGMRVSRIVSISEISGTSPQPRPMSRLAMNESADAMSTPVAGGQVSYTVNVQVKFELTK